MRRRGAGSHGSPDRGKGVENLRGLQNQANGQADFSLYESGDFRGGETVGRKRTGTKAGTSKTTSQQEARRRDLASSGGDAAAQSTDLAEPRQAQVAPTHPRMVAPGLGIAYGQRVS